MTATAGYLTSRRQARFVFALLFLLYTLDYMARLVIVALFPALKQEWGVTDTQCGLLVSAVYWSILVFALPVSVLVDRWSRKKSIALMAILWSVATAACAFVRGFGPLLAARAVVGIGEAGYAPGGAAMLSAAFSAEQRARVIGLWNASIPLGSALGMVIGGLISDHIGWRYAFVIVAVPGLLAGLLFFGVTDYQTVDLARGAGREGEPDRSRQGPGEIALQFARNRTLLFNNLGFAANTFVTTSLLTWLPTYFHRTEGIPMTQAGTRGAGVMLLAVVGAPLGGILADRWRSRRRNARMLLPAVSSLATAIALFLAFSAFPPGGAQYAMLLVAGLAAVAFAPAATAVTQDVVHPGLRATSASVCVVVQHLLGSAIGPTFVGVVSDRTDLTTALTLLPAFTFIAAILFFAGSFFYEADVGRVDDVALEAER
jgi:predicted MFS family arabinose efflux permease